MKLIYNYHGYIVLKIKIWKCFECFFFLSEDILLQNLLLQQTPVFLYISD